MQPGEKKLVVLGSSITALAVARGAARDRIPVVLVDTHNGIASRSSAGRVEILSPDAVRGDPGVIEAFGGNGRNWLLATSDTWLRFIVKNRKALEDAFGAVLHPSNEILRICLEKERFSSWCMEKGFRTPRRYTAGELSENGAPCVEFPLLIRPSASHAAGCDLPKATEVSNEDDLRQWLLRFHESGVEAVVTESLLGHRLTQYSVGLVRRGSEMASFVAKKVRPLPEHCAVGSYVELDPNAEVERMARAAAEALEYYGIAEFEILHSHDNGNSYLIEINARPWTQYALALDSGHDLLAFLIRPQLYDADKELKAGKRWLDFSDDLFNCFSRSVGIVRHGHVGLAAYFLSLLRANTYSRFSFRDAGPFWHELAMQLRAVFRVKQ